MGISYKRFLATDNAVALEFNCAAPSTSYVDTISYVYALNAAVCRDPSELAATDVLRPAIVELDYVVLAGVLSFAGCYCSQDAFLTPIGPG
jgi:hypothetical protein